MLQISKKIIISDDYKDRKRVIGIDYDEKLKKKLKKHKAGYEIYE